MTPGWVRDLQDYWVAIERAIEASGGDLSEAFVVIEPIEVIPNKWAGLLVEQQRLRFHDGSYLDFAFSIRSDLDLIAYNFHYGRWDDQLVWRYDKHFGHEREDGGDTHVHLPNDVRKPHEGMDMFDALELIVQDQNDERRPRHT